MEHNLNRGGGERPSPDDFVAYLPWVCGQLQLPTQIVVKRVLREEYVSGDVKKTRGKAGNMPSVTNLYRKDVISKSSQNMDRDLDTSIITIIAVYSADHLVEIKFDKVKKIPPTVFKIIGLILQFYGYLSSISINGGLDKLCLYELSQLVPVSNITDICLDGTFLREANYYLLLEKETRLKQLSLRRCSIDDVVLETITSKLIFPLPASQTLSILNLSTNRITDIGAISLACALKSNRQLSYLNLSSNMLTDAGAGVILDTLKEFPMNREEVKDSRARLMMYLRERNNVISKQSGFKEENEKLKKSQTRPVMAKRVRNIETDKEQSGKSTAALKETVYSESTMIRKVDTAAQNYLGVFKDPFSTAEVVVKDGLVNSLGNNCLCYLNLAYNNLSYLSVEKILTVLNYQSNCARSPRIQTTQSCPKEGLVNINIEGNPMPTECEMLTEIDKILRSKLNYLNKKPFNLKKPIRR